MSRQRLRVLDIIKSEIAETGQWPTARKIADQMGWKNSTAVADCLTALVRYGKLRRVNSYGSLMQRYEVID